MYNIILIISLLLLAGCVNQQPAEVEYNHNQGSGNKNFNRASASTDDVSASTFPDSKSDGETITAKPLKTSDDLDDRAQGSLKDPYQTIKPNIVKPNNKVIYHEVERGESLQQIATDYDQTEDELAAFNELQPPYKLKEGQVVKIEISNATLNKKNTEHIAKLEPINSLKASDTASTLSDEEDTQTTTNIEKEQIPSKAKVASSARQADYIRPVKGKIITNFGEQINGSKNNGINLASIAGSSIKSIGNGTVVHAGNDAKFGNLIIVKLDNSNLFVAYAHMDDLLLEKGRIVKAGEVIGHVGSTGEVQEPQLHFAIREGKIAVNPLKYIKQGFED